MWLEDTNARMNRGITPKSSAPRYALKAPDREVAFRLELDMVPNE
jgi:hypothetical protein